MSKPKTVRIAFTRTEILKVRLFGFKRLFAERIKDLGIDPAWYDVESVVHWGTNGCRVWNLIRRKAERLLTFKKNGHYSFCTCRGCIRIEVA